MINMYAFNAIVTVYKILKDNQSSGVFNYCYAPLENRVKT